MRLLQGVPPAVDYEFHLDYFCASRGGTLLFTCGMVGGLVCAQDNVWRRRMDRNVSLDSARKPV